MTDHWQTIEDALTFARRHSEGFWLYQNSKMRPSELVAQIDAALAFVREQRRVPTARTIVDAGVGKSIMVGFEDIFDDDVPTERTPQQTGRYVPVEDGWADETIAITHNGKVLRFEYENDIGQMGSLSAKLPDGIRLCRWQEGDTPQPDWSTAPPEAQWWAMDINGGAYWYGAKPEMGEEGAWLTTYDTVWDDTKCPNWKDTLTQRPQPTDAAKEGETNE